jgi:hypothetical protein
MILIAEHQKRNTVTLALRNRRSTLGAPAHGTANEDLAKQCANGHARILAADRND